MILKKKWNNIVAHDIRLLLNWHLFMLGKV